MSFAPTPIGIEFTLNQSGGHAFSDVEIASLGFTPCVTSPPGTPQPPTGFWTVAGTKVADYITLWIYKRLGFLIIIGSIEED